ncbi:hypothetical protein BH10ACT1_BH10ACT1_11600 [soil metagenome]
MSRSVAHVAASDCERCRPGLVAQPANTASSLAYVATGALAVRAARRRPKGRPSEAALGWATVAAGLGSVAYHGPGTTFGRYVHDASLLAMLGLVALADAELVAGSTAPQAAVVAVPLVAAAAAHPATSMLAQVAAGVAAAVGEGLRMRATPATGARLRWRQAEAWVAGGGAMLHLLGRTGGPLCRPDSLLQPHSAWHVATASTVWFRSCDLDH